MESFQAKNSRSNYISTWPRRPERSELTSPTNRIILQLLRRGQKSAAKCEADVDVVVVVVVVDAVDVADAVASHQPSEILDDDDLCNVPIGASLIRFFGR